MDTERRRPGLTLWCVVPISRVEGYTKIPRIDLSHLELVNPCPTSPSARKERVYLLRLYVVSMNIEKPTHVTTTEKY